MLLSVPTLILASLLTQVTMAAPTPGLLPPGGTALTMKIKPDPNDQLWNTGSKIIPQPIRGPVGATIIGPENIDLELQNADTFAPPTTDHGSVPGLKWPFSLSHNRLSKGGWSRQQNGMYFSKNVIAPSESRSSGCNACGDCFGR